MTERELSEAVRELATMFGWRMYHTYDSRRSEPGFPDLILLRKGSMIVAELKTEKGKLSAAQEEWMDDFRWVLAESWGGLDYVEVWRPSDLDEIARVLR